ncbi:uncharacterized protein EDB91DRAFT_1159937 [Suillus paluster]|uniref:uncharacterized protein n=1 Tax=Suillus paluster TaxID=48578 RepID=UPI001B866EBB|nr:uncharacterized protein EDB91DRAFT_1159937 [Suillus paluster]KAG1729192.1 hypothetical protein EDB91DRAFT_1159937 [Suillus paluster]
MSFSTQSTSPMGVDGVVRCLHGEAATRRTSHTSDNPNRDFYTCARRNMSEKCRFFYWVDDPIFQRQNIRVSPPAPVPSIPPPSQRQRAELARGLATPQKSPSSRLADIEAALNGPGPQAPSMLQHNSSIPPPSQRQTTESFRGLNTPQKSPRKRLADIEDEPVPQTPSMSQHSTSQPNTTVTNSVSRSFLFGDPQPSQASTTVDLDDGLPEEFEPSSSDDNGSSVNPVHFGPGGADPRTPKKSRITPVEPPAHYLPMTPPQTDRRPADTNFGQGTFQVADFPPTPTRNKGKERANTGGEQMTAGANAPVPGPSESRSNTLERTLSNPFIVEENTIGERISSHLESLIALSAAPYVLKLEKRVSALDKSNKFKAKYIENMKDSESENTRLTEENAGLERENARLKQEIADLQERLRQSEQSSRVKDIEIAAIKSRRPPNM